MGLESDKISVGGFAASSRCVLFALLDCSQARGIAEHTMSNNAEKKPEVLEEDDDEPGDWYEPF